MEVKLSFALIICLLILHEISGYDVADVPHLQRGPILLHRAVKHLVNYTASEAKASLDMNSIGSTVAAIAYQKLNEKLGQ